MLANQGKLAFPWSYGVVLPNISRKQFSFKSVGIQAQGRTTILKINYPNTKQILQIASLGARGRGPDHHPPAHTA